MIKKISLLLIFIISFLQADTLLEVMKKENRVALVIGNNNYQRPWGNLYNPINDAKSIKQILEDRGFNVIYKENASRRGIRESLEDFYQKIKNGGIGLFYFAGHGIELNGKNYLIPIGAKCKKEIDVEFETIALNRIIKNMKDINNRLNIVILDACRNNPFLRGGKGGLAKIEPRGLFISYATEAGKVALDGKKGGHGLFTENLIKYMKKPLNLHNVFKKTRTDVRNASFEKQFPAIYDQTDGEFLFTLPQDNQTIIDDFNLSQEWNPKTKEFSLLTLLNFFISKKNSKSLNTIFIIFFIFGFSLIIFISITSFLYSERTNYILKMLAVSIFFFGISGYILSTFLHISDKLSLFTSVIISIFIFIFIVFLAPKNQPQKTPKPISLIDCQAILLDDVKIGNTGHATIITDSSRYRKLVRNKSANNLLKGDEVIVMNDEAIPTVSKK